MGPFARRAAPRVVARLPGGPAPRALGSPHLGRRLPRVQHYLGRACQRGGCGPTHRTRFVERQRCPFDGVAQPDSDADHQHSYRRRLPDPGFGTASQYGPPRHDDQHQHRRWRLAGARSGQGDRRDPEASRRDRPSTARRPSRDGPGITRRSGGYPVAGARRPGGCARGSKLGPRRIGSS